MAKRKEDAANGALDVSFILMDREKGTAIPVDSLPPEEWERLRDQIIRGVGRSLGEIYAREGKLPF